MANFQYNSLRYNERFSYNQTKFYENTNLLSSYTYKHITIQGATVDQCKLHCNGQYVDYLILQQSPIDGKNLIQSNFYKDSNYARLDILNMKNICPLYFKFSN